MMLLKKGKPLLKHWMMLHPYNKPTASDQYYFKIAQQIHRRLSDSKYKLMTDRLSEEQISFLCNGLTCYFEDIISGFGLWQTFTNEHYKVYGNYLPFYNTEEYYPDEINIEDVQFLIWHNIEMLTDKESSYSPVSNFITILADEVYDIFDAEYEFAPVNNLLREYYYFQENKTDFYEVRTVLQNFMLNTYLFHFSGNLLEEKFSETMSQATDDFMLRQRENIFNETLDSFVFSQRMSLMAYRINEWYAKFLGETHPLYHHILKLDKKKQGYFIFTKEDSTNLYFRHLATDFTLPATKKSITRNDQFIENKTMFYIGFAQWMEEWWFSGIYSTFDYRDQIIVSEKKSLSSLNLFNEDIDKKIQILSTQYNDFLEFNEGSPIAYFANIKLANTYLEDFQKFITPKLNHSDEERENALNRLQLIQNANPSDEEANDDTPCLIYFNPNSGTEIAFGFNDVIPDPRNPFFDPSHNPDEEVFLLYSEYISGTLANYLKERFDFKHLKFNNEPKGSNLLMKNFDFLSRYFKLNEYHNEPRITIL